MTPRILYRDRDILIAEKPVGLLSQTDAAGGDSLPLRLEQQGYPVRPVHRLDRTTGGVMVYALSDKAAASLSAALGDHERFVKEYLAVVSGEPEESSMLEDLLYHDRAANKSYVVRRPRNGVRRARLQYTRLACRETPQGTVSLVRVRLYTGRTHQIRVQFASRGMPLVGDRRYGGTGAEAPALWSCRLTFPHPLTGETVTASSLPDTGTYPWSEFRDFLSELS